MANEGYWRGVGPSLPRRPLQLASSRARLSLRLLPSLAFLHSSSRGWSTCTTTTWPTGGCPGDGSALGALCDGSGSGAVAHLSCPITVIRSAPAEQPPFTPHSPVFFLYALPSLKHSGPFTVCSDVKLDNTLLDGQAPPLVKLCDFQFAK